MTEIKMDMSHLDRDQVERIAQHLIECVTVQLANNNDFIMAMQQAGALPDECIDLMNAWSARSNYISAKSDDELARIASGDDGRTVN